MALLGDTGYPGASKSHDSRRAWTFGDTAKSCSVSYLFVNSPSCPQDPRSFSSTATQVSAHAKWAGFECHWARGTQLWRMPFYWAVRFLCLCGSGMSASRWATKKPRRLTVPTCRSTSESKVESARNCARAHHPTLVIPSKAPTQLRKTTRSAVCRQMKSLRLFSRRCG